MRINPEETPLTAEYWEGMRHGRIMIQQCQECETVWHPPEPVCPHCQSLNVSWVQASGKGHLYTYTWVQHATHQAFSESIPYLVVMVELEEGPRVVSTIPGIEYGPVEIGMPVTAIFPDDADAGLLKFAPAQAE